MADLMAADFTASAEQRHEQVVLPGRPGSDWRRPRLWQPLGSHPQYPPGSRYRRRHFPPAREQLRAAFQQPAAASRSACPTVRIWLACAAEPRGYPSYDPLGQILEGEQARSTSNAEPRITGVMEDTCVRKKQEAPPSKARLLLRQVIF